MENKIKKIVLLENEVIEIETSFACLKIENKDNRLIVTEKELEQKESEARNNKNIQKENA